MFGHRSDEILVNLHRGREMRCTMCESHAARYPSTKLCRYLLRLSSLHRLISKNPPILRDLPIDCFYISPNVYRSMIKCEIPRAGDSLFKIQWFGALAHHSPSICQWSYWVANPPTEPKLPKSYIGQVLTPVGYPIASQFWRYEYTHAIHIMCQQFNSYNKIYKPSTKQLLSIYWPFLY